MPKFGTSSKTKLAQAHPDLQRLFNEVIKYWDCSVIYGARGQVEQDRLFAEGKSKLKYPHSKHNVKPGQKYCMAVDVVPYYADRTPHIDWNDMAGFYMFVGFVKAMAITLGINIRCGADWDNDNDTKDQSFHDLPHFELVS